MKIKDTHHIRKCSSCRFFVEFANNPLFGCCHRNAPMPVKRIDNHKDLYFILLEAPIVHYQFWCGQYEKSKKS